MQAAAAAARVHARPCPRFTPHLGRAARQQTARQRPARQRHQQRQRLPPPLQQRQAPAAHPDLASLPHAAAPAAARAPDSAPGCLLMLGLTAAVPAPAPASPAAPPPTHAAACASLPLPAACCAALAACLRQQQQRPLPLPRRGRPPAAAAGRRGSYWRRRSCRRHCSGRRRCHQLAGADAGRRVAAAHQGCFGMQMAGCCLHALPPLPLPRPPPSLQQRQREQRGTR